MYGYICKGITNITLILQICNPGVSKGLTYALVNIYNYLIKKQFIFLMHT